MTLVLFARLGRWIVAILVALCLSELSYRITDWIRYGMPVFSPFRAVEDLLVRDSDGMHGRANAQFQKWIMNDVGTRGPSVPVTPPPGTVRIIAVGASETFGLYESPNHEFPRQLEDSLADVGAVSLCRDGSPVRFQVLNAAFAGMSIPTIDQDLRLRLRRLRPTIVVAYLPPVEYLLEHPPVVARPDSSARDDPPPLQVLLYPRMLDLLRSEVKQAVPGFVLSGLRERTTRNTIETHDASWRFVSPPTDRLQAFDTDVRRLVGSIKEIGAVPVLVTHANAFAGRRSIDRPLLTAWGKFYPRATGSTIVAFDSLARIAILKIAADSSLLSVDATLTMAAAPTSSFADYAHFTDGGAAVMAGAVAAGVRRWSALAPCR